MGLQIYCVKCGRGFIIESKDFESSELKCLKCLDRETESMKTCDQIVGYKLKMGNTIEIALKKKYVPGRFRRLLLKFLIGWEWEPIYDIYVTGITVLQPFHDETTGKA